MSIYKIKTKLCHHLLCCNLHSFKIKHADNSFKIKHANTGVYILRPNIALGSL